MQYLLVGKTGVFDTLAVAYGYLDKMDINTSPFLADLALENSKKLINLGEDQEQNQVFVVGFKEPEIIYKINQDLSSLSNIEETKRLQVIPLQIEGENTTWLLSKLANIPLVGSLFLNWAKSRTMNRSSYLLNLGKNLRIEKVPDAKNKKDLILAAKPYRNGGKT
jgi:hypothetical protein